MGEGAAIPVTAMLAERCRGIRYEDLPADAVFVAKQCLLDWLAVTVAGSREPLAGMLRETVREEGGNPQATLIGTGERVTVPQAALVNGGAGHALDYDDVHMAMSGHPSVPVIPALLALAQARGADGRAVIAALVAGIEMEARVGALVMPEHYARGFHSTGTVGTFGAAAACAHLLGLDQGQWQHALGIAGAQAAGMKSMFGTMTKPLQAAKAAVNGLLAARLAERGFTANPEVLETAQGFAATQTATFAPERAVADWPGFAIRDVLFKYHAACYGTHETIEGVLRLRERNGIAPDDVAGIELTVPAGNLRMCNIREPATGLEGKFSMRFAAALALATGDTTEAAFTDAATREPALVAVRDRVEVRASDGGAGTTVAVRLRDGRELREHVDLTVPAQDLEQQWERLAAKFRGLVAPVLGTGAAEAAIAAVRELERVDDIGRVVALVAEAAPAGAAS
ncbi:MAG: MmgE/PrpD family protein [Hyphomicrobiales bacterium]